MIFNAPAGNCLPITIRTGSPAGFRLTSESREPGERAGRAIIQPASINGCVTWAVSAPPVLPHSHPCGHRYGEGQKLFHKNQLLSVPRDTPIIGKIFPIVNSGLRKRPHNQVAPAPSADNTGQESARHGTIMIVRSRIIAETREWSQGYALLSRGHKSRPALSQ